MRSCAPFVAQVPSRPGQPSDLNTLAATHLFKQDTIESINQATQLYLLAWELLGRARQEITDMHGVSVLVDPISAEHVRGSVVDFSDSLTGGGFKISNPNARQSCGCGKSFEA